MSDYRAITPADLVAELQSGRWCKARRQLRRSTNHRCCLGVACELIGLTWDGDWVEGPNGQISTQYVPADATKTYAPWLTAETQLRLTKLNDNKPGWVYVIAALRRMS